MSIVYINHKKFITFTKLKFKDLKLKLEEKMELTQTQLDLLIDSIYQNNTFAGWNESERANYIEGLLDPQESGDWTSNALKISQAFNDLSDYELEPNETDKLTPQQIEEIIKGCALDPIA